MTLPGKGTRTITVDGVGYRWRVLRDEDNPAQMSYAVLVEHTARPGALAEIRFQYQHCPPRVPSVIGLLCPIPNLGLLGHFAALGMGSYRSRAGTRS